MFFSFPPELAAMYRWRITASRRTRVKGFWEELVCVVEKSPIADATLAAVTRATGHSVFRGEAHSYVAPDSAAEPHPKPLTLVVIALVGSIGLFVIIGSIYALRHARKRRGL
eukprot:GHVT01003409.1.p1 GENE.GHVT01003409.1~~GHVT01003409.1.p1  ORF type:complete len:112 (-),score=5.62 GHVT01003409.1:120-455(-)